MSYAIPTLHDVRLTHHRSERLGEPPTNTVEVEARVDTVPELVAIARQLGNDPAILSGDYNRVRAYYFKPEFSLVVRAPGSLKEARELFDIDKTFDGGTPDLKAVE